jgi:hypothetical protein
MPHNWIGLIPGLGLMAERRNLDHGIKGAVVKFVLFIVSGTVSGGLVMWNTVSNHEIEIRHMKDTDSRIEQTIKADRDYYESQFSEISRKLDDIRGPIISMTSEQRKVLMEQRKKQSFWGK